MIIAFIGADGSGKTTIADHVLWRLYERGGQVKYRHHYDGLVYKQVAKFTKKKDKKVIIKPTLVKKLWLYVMYPIFLLRWVSDKFEQGIVVRDRYAYDSLIGWTLQGRTNVISRWLLTYLPKPDHIFLVDALPQTLMKRKPQDYLNLGQCREKREAYLSLAMRRSIPIVSSERSIEKSVKDVMEAI